jgi:molybdopterin-guanine dinucleotide biosynthesis protein A
MGKALFSKNDGIGACLIAGGKSRRMGRDKRFLPVGGTPLISRELRVLDELFAEVIIVLAEPISGWNAGRHQIVYDAVPNCGSLGGLYTGLVHAVSARIFAVAADMPFLNADVIKYLVRRAPDADVVAVRVGPELQPLHAVYSKRCVPILLDMAVSRSLRIQDIFTEPRLNVKIISDNEIAHLDSGYLSFRNINTPEDYDVAQELLARRGDF